MLSSLFRRINGGSLLRSKPRELLSITQFSPLDRSNDQIRWATKKAGGTVKNSKDSKPKYLGIKKFGGEWCKPGNIILRQRGQKYRPGEYVGMGRDFTIWALVEGQVKFWEKRVESERTGEKRKKTGVSIIPGVKPEKKRKPLLPWFDSVIRRRRRQKKLKFEPIKKQNRLFQYTWPKVTILPEVTIA